ncbi:MAG: hypothetical protein GC156_11675 [Actinomycetales bacterium]|nr:hypothetical protein [Actinomycetales bacterium]
MAVAVVGSLAVLLIIGSVALTGSTTGRQAGPQAVSYAGGEAPTDAVDLPSGLSITGCQATGGLGGAIYFYVFGTNTTDVYFNAEITVDVRQKDESVDSQTFTGRWGPGSDQQIAAGETNARYDVDSAPATCSVTAAHAT